MSINDQLAAYRAKKAAQKEAESRDNSSFFTKTFSALKSRGKTTGSSQSTTREQTQEDMSQNEKSDSEHTQPPASTNPPPHRDVTSPHRDVTSPHRDLLTPPVAPRPNVLSRVFLQDGRIFTWPRVLKGLLWLILYGLFIELQFGCVFFIVSLFYFVYTSMESGTRDKTRPSAYSVFNENCERIDGTFTTEQFEKELRYGAMSVH